MINSSKIIVLVIRATIPKRKEGIKTTNMIVDKTRIIIIDKIGGSILIDNFMRTTDSIIIGILDIMIMRIDFIKDLHNNKIVHNFSLKVINKVRKILFKIHSLTINNNNNNSRFKVIIW